jgi:hypothetical protein
MGILRDIFDIAHDNARDVDFDIDGAFGDDEEGRPITKYRPVSYDSIVKQAKKGTMQFPLICTRSLDYEDIQTIAKACEIDFASMLQVVFTMNQTTNTDNPQEFINQYHQNINNNIRGAGDMISLVFNSAEIPIDIRSSIVTENREQLVPYNQQFEMKTVNEKFEPINSREQLMEGKRWNAFRSAIGKGKKKVITTATSAKNNAINAAGDTVKSEARNTKKAFDSGVKDGVSKALSNIGKGVADRLPGTPGKVAGGIAALGGAAAAGKWAIGKYNNKNTGGTNFASDHIDNVHIGDSYQSRKDDYKKKKKDNDVEAPKGEEAAKEGWYIGNGQVMEVNFGNHTSANSGGVNFQGKVDHVDHSEQHIGSYVDKYEDKSKASYDTHIHQAKGYNPYQIVRDQIPANIFADSDVKKANDLAPTLMNVRILKEMGEDSKYVSFVCGVKAVIHPVNSDDMIDHITSALRERGKLFRFLQWTTGEISFFKDLVFNIDQAKKDIKEIRSGKASTWWRALKNIKASRRFHKWTRTGPVLPNATIVISMDEVEYIKSNHGFDLMEEELGEKILKAYNLIQFIIVDPSSQVVYFMADGETRYRMLTYKGLERQAGQADKQFKEILRAANKLQ